MQLKNKKITVVGLARSGVYAAKLCAAQGGLVTVSDKKSEAELTEFKAMLQGVQYKLETGGHSEEAFLGADLIVVSPGVPSDTELFNKARTRGVEIIGEIELAYRFLKGRFIGITGTKGKTTTTTLTGLLLARGLKNVSVAGNIGNPLTAFALAAKTEVTYVLELSSFQLETVKTFKPDIALITNISEDHMDRYKNIQDYVEAKSMIFRKMTKNEILILNASDKYTPLYSNIAGANVIYFSSRSEVQEGGFLRDGKIYVRWNGQEHLILPASELLIKGMHNVENAMAAATIAVINRIVPSQIAEVLRKFEGVEHRQEFSGELNGVRFINNSQGTNIDAVEKSLLSYNAPIILIAGGRNKGSDFSLLRETVKKTVKKIILIGESKKQIRAALKGATRMEDAADMESAVQAAFKSAEGGDVVLLSPACASFDMFRNYQERGQAFKDAVKKIVDGSAD